MPRPGTKPQPTALKLLKGNPGRRKLPRREPKPDPSMPVCPTWLDPVAKRQWAKLAPELNRMGVLAKIDGNLLARYCQTWSQWRKMIEWVQKHGETTPIKSEEGRVTGHKRNPQTEIAKGLSEMLTRLEPELGMTPSGRTRLEVSTKPKPKGGIMGLMRGPSKKSG